MSSKWIWNSVNLWVSEEDISREIKRAELFVLDATESVYHFFGTGSRKYTFKGIVTGDTDANSLDTDAKGNTARTLTTPYGTIASLRINNLKLTAKNYAGGTIGGVDYTIDVTPLYDVELEFVTAP
jgi:hypothetical protein